MEASEMQRAICAAIARYVQREGWPPTRREIGQAVGITSTGLVNYHLEALEKRGYLEMVRRSSRAIRLTAAGKRLIGASAA